jgi:hypothetical protein
LPNKYYDSIYELPVFNWWKMHEKNDSSFLLKDKTLAVCDRAHAAFKKIQAQFIDEFGISDEYRKYLQLRVKMELMYIDQVRTGDKSNQAIIETIKIDIEQLFSQKKPNHNAGVLYLSKAAGAFPDVMTMSVYRYYSLLKELSNGRK